MAYYPVPAKFNLGTLF